VGLDACSPAREAGAGTLRHPGALAEDGAGWAAGVPPAPDVLLVWVGAVDWDATVEAAVWADPVTELMPELEEPHAASIIIIIIITAAVVVTHAAGLLAPRDCRRRRQRAR
jgi:hypothetical protein